VFALQLDLDRDSAEAAVGVATAAWMPWPRSRRSSSGKRERWLRKVLEACYVEVYNKIYVWDP
jgi:hypothetical protein